MLIVGFSLGFGVLVRFLVCCFDLDLFDNWYCGFVFVFLFCRCFGLNA